MMLNLVSGERLRTQSNRRYVVVADHGKGAYVAYRTDVLGRAETRAMKMGYRLADPDAASRQAATKALYAGLKISTGQYMAAMRDIDVARVPVAHVYDNTTGEVVR